MSMVTASMFFIACDVRLRDAFQLSSMGCGPGASSDEAQVIVASRRGQKEAVCHVLPMLCWRHSDETQISPQLTMASLISIKQARLPVDRGQSVTSSCPLTLRLPIGGD